MFIMRVLTWEDALHEKSAWDTMIWAGVLIHARFEAQRIWHGEMVWKGDWIISWWLPALGCFYACSRGVFLFALFLRERDCSNYCAVPCVPLPDDRSRSAGLSGCHRVGLFEQRLWLPDPIRNRLGAGYVTQRE